MSALLLSAVHGTGWETSVTLSAHHPLAVESLGKGGQGRVIDTTTEAKYQVKGGFLLDVIIGKRAAIL